MNEPFSENDPVFKLLGKAKSVEPRADFTQNVLRAIRQDTTKRSLLQNLLGFWYEPLKNKGLITGLAAACALALVFAWEPLSQPSSKGLITYQNSTPSLAVESPPMDAPTLIEDGVESDWETIEELDHLLAVQNTSDLSDSQIALLLY